MSSPTKSNKIMQQAENSPQDGLANSKDNPHTIDKPESPQKIIQSISEPNSHIVNSPDKIKSMKADSSKESLIYIKRRKNKTKTQVKSIETTLDNLGILKKNIDLSNFNPTISHQHSRSDSESEHLGKIVDSVGSHYKGTRNDNNHSKELDNQQFLNKFKGLLSEKNKNGALDDLKHSGHVEFKGSYSLDKLSKNLKGNQLIEEASNTNADKIKQGKFNHKANVLKGLQNTIDISSLIKNLSLTTNNNDYGKGSLVARLKSNLEGYNPIENRLKVEKQGSNEKYIAKKIDETNALLEKSKKFINDHHRSAVLEVGITQELDQKLRLVKQNSSIIHDNNAEYQFYDNMINDLISERFVQTDEQEDTNENPNKEIITNQIDDKKFVYPTIDFTSLTRPHEDEEFRRRVDKITDIVRKQSNRIINRDGFGFSVIEAKSRKFIKAHVMSSNMKPNSPAKTYIKNRSMYKFGNSNNNDESSRLSPSKMDSIFNNNRGKVLQDPVLQNQYSSANNLSDYLGNSMIYKDGTNNNTQSEVVLPRIDMKEYPNINSPTLKPANLIDFNIESDNANENDNNTNIIQDFNDKVAAKKTILKNIINADSNVEKKAYNINKDSMMMTTAGIGSGGVNGVGNDMNLSLLDSIAGDTAKGNLNKKLSINKRKGKLLPNLRLALLQNKNLSSGELSSDSIRDYDLDLIIEKNKRTQADQKVTKDGQYNNSRISKLTLDEISSPKSTQKFSKKRFINKSKGNSMERNSTVSKTKDNLSLMNKINSESSMKSSLNALKTKKLISDFLNTVEDTKLKSQMHTKILLKQMEEMESDYQKEFGIQLPSIKRMDYLEDQNDMEFKKGQGIKQYSHKVLSVFLSH